MHIDFFLINLYKRMSHEIDQLEFQEYLSLRVIADFHVENNTLDATELIFECKFYINSTHYNMILLS